jgi:hypothetical protein
MPRKGYINGIFVAVYMLMLDGNSTFPNKNLYNLAKALSMKRSKDEI